MESKEIKSPNQWQKIKVKTPTKTGAYFIHVQANGKQAVLPMIVSK